MNKFILAFIFIPILIIVAFNWRTIGGNNVATTTPSVVDSNIPQKPVVCMEEALQCSDGSYVSRTGPNCEFAPCPKATSTPVACMMEAKICPDGSAVGRSGPKCEFTPCPNVTEKNCPQYAPPGPNFCPDGIIVSGGLDKDGCQLPPKCSPRAQDGCVIGGCSSQLCGEKGSDLVSTCEYRNEYQCYKLAFCEKQATGKCAWTKNNQFNSCVASFID